MSVADWLRLALLAAIAASCLPHQVTCQDPSTINELGLTTAELIERVGFQTRSHPLQVEPGYVLDLVQIVNPTINCTSRGSVIFVHGIFSDCGIFLVNSVGAKPANYANKDASKMSKRELQALLASDQTAKVTPLLLSNFGFDVWMMNRRPVSTSLANSGHPELLAAQKSGGALVKGIETILQPFVRLVNGPLTSTLGGLLEFVPQTLIQGFVDVASSLMVPQLQSISEPGYFNFTIDTQARIDMPTVVDYVLSLAGAPKLVLIGHSLGAGIIPMSLAVNPDLNNKVSAAILWAPAVDGGHGTMSYLNRLARDSRRLLTVYTGPLFPYSLTVSLQDLAALLCQFSFIQNSLCNSIIDILLGEGANQLIFNPGYFQNALSPCGSKEFLQLAQAYESGSMHFYNFDSDQQNLANYGNTTPPAYDFSIITIKQLVIFQGNTDALVTPQDTQFFIRQLSVTVDLRRVGSSTAYFNHISYMFHEDSVEEVSIPTLELTSKAFATA